MSPIHRSITGIGICAAFALIAGCATTDSFAKLDANRDGAGSCAEFDNYMKKEVFICVDSNADGKVVLSEWQTFNPKVDAKRFGQADINRDGFITRTEADATFDREGSLKKLFARIDTDGNGSLSRPEVKAFRAQVRQNPGTTQIDTKPNSSQP
jgi:Ca2+-binding EF-hand superfamily protein